MSIFFSQITWLFSYFSGRSVMSGSILQSQILSGSIFYTLLLSQLLIHLRERKKKAFCSVYSLYTYFFDFHSFFKWNIITWVFFIPVFSPRNSVFRPFPIAVLTSLFSFESFTFPWLLWQPLYNVLWHEQTAGTWTNRKPQKFSLSIVIFVFLALSQLSLLVLSNFAILLTTAPFYCSLYPSTANLYWKAIHLSPRLPQQHNPR